MDELQDEYRQELSAIMTSKASPTVKRLLLESLINTLRDVNTWGRDNDFPKQRGNIEVLSTSISESFTSNLQTEKDVEELEEKIIKLQMVKIENNEDVETMEEELYEMEKIVKARIEYDEYLKKRIDSRMEEVQKVSD